MSAAVHRSEPARCREIRLRDKAEVFAAREMIRGRTRVDENGCWIWTGSYTGKGYGGAWFRGQRYRAHRLSYVAHQGAIPDGMQVDHLCRVRKCCNPEHLEAVSNRENTLRGSSMAARLAKQTHCKRGHEFTPENTRIRRRTGHMSRMCIACARAARAALRSRIQAA